MHVLNSFILKGSWIIFNPPYVTTNDDEYKRALEKKDIYASWAGGKKGSETIFKFIYQLKNFIKDNSIIYLLLSKENEYFKIINDIHNCINFQFEILMKRKATNEKLAVFKFFKWLKIKNEMIFMDCKKFIFIIIKKIFMFKFYYWN